MRRILIGMIAAGSVFGQSVPGSPAFEVASVKPSPPIRTGPNRSIFMGGPKTDPGRATWSNVPLRYLVMQAYGYTIAWRLEGGPGWFSSDTFDIVGTFPADTAKEQIPLMLRTLLIDRFKLATHVETKEHAVYALSIAKSGLKIRESAADDTPPMSRTGIGHMELHKVTMQRVADLLSTTTMGMSERPVVDMTGLKGLFGMTLDWAPENASTDGTQPVKPSFFTAISEPLGLKLEAQKVPVEFLVIDHAEKPLEN